MTYTYHRGPSRLYGVAINYTYIDEEGRMWVGNNEYETQVNYCPWTGQPAPKKMVAEESKLSEGGKRIYEHKDMINE